MTLNPDTTVFLHTPVERTLLARAWALADRRGEFRSDYIASLLFRGVIADESEAEARVRSEDAARVEGAAV